MSAGLQRPAPPDPAPAPIWNIPGIPVYRGAKREPQEARLAPPADHRGEWRTGPL
jgi:hypothetical protein